MDELAFVSIAAFSRRIYVPFLTHFGLVVFVDRVLLLVYELWVAVSIGAVTIELTLSLFHPVFAQLSLII